MRIRFRYNTGVGSIRVFYVIVIRAKGFNGKSKQQAATGRQWKQREENSKKQSKGHTRAETEKAMAPHCSTLVWKIPWTEEPGRLQSIASQRIRHN